VKNFLAEINVRKNRQQESLRTFILYRDGIGYLSNGVKRE